MNVKVTNKGTKTYNYKNWEKEGEGEEEVDIS